MGNICKMEFSWLHCQNNKQGNFLSRRQLSRQLCKPERNTSDVYCLYYKETLELALYIFDLHDHALFRYSIAETWLDCFQVHLQPRKSNSDFLQHGVCTGVVLCRFSELFYTGNDREPMYRDTEVIRYVLHWSWAVYQLWLSAVLLCLIWFLWRHFSFSALCFLCSSGQVACITQLQSSAPTSNVTWLSHWPVYLTQLPVNLDNRKSTKL